MKWLYHETAVWEGNKERNDAPSNALTTPVTCILPSLSSSSFTADSRGSASLLWGFAALLQIISASLLYSENADNCIMRGFCMGILVLGISVLSATLFMVSTTHQINAVLSLSCTTGVHCEAQHWMCCRLTFQVKARGASERTGSRDLEEASNAE